VNDGASRRLDRVTPAAGEDWKDGEDSRSDEQVLDSSSDYVALCHTSSRSAGRASSLRCSSIARVEAVLSVVSTDKVSTAPVL